MKVPHDALDELGQDLFRELLIDHYKNPRNKGRLEPADVREQADNPACGDEIEVTARIKDGRLTEIAFIGHGCAISQAAASLLYEEIQGKAIEEILSLDRQHIEGLIGIELRPARVKCGVLGLNTLKHGINARTAAKPKASRPVPGFRGKEVA